MKTKYFILFLGLTSALTIAIFGIVLTGYNEMVNFAEDARLNFKLYYPENPEKFKEYFKLKLNTAQTILCDKGSVSMVLFGSINGKDYTKILKKTKSLLRSNE